MYSFSNMLCLAGLTLVGVQGLTGCAPAQAPRVATAFAAHVLCSGAYVSERDPMAIFEQHISTAPGLRHVAKAMRVSVDDTARAVSVSLGGAFEETAVFAMGRGCTVAGSGVEVAPINRVRPVVPGPPPRSSDQPDLEAALDALFADEAQAALAVVVLRGGDIVTERYAPGIGPETALLSWSVAKSLVHALVGLLVMDGDLDVHAPAPVGAWADPADPRHAVTVDHLLRQVSGQPFGSANTGFDRASRMLFLSGDTAGTSATARFTPPGQRGWSYTDGNYAILSGILKDRVGGPEDLVQFAEQRLFQPAGMKHVTLEFDRSGTMMGAAFVLASARDWARFGQLYLDNGVVEGHRILPESWVRTARSETAGAEGGYGAGFWINAGQSTGARARRAMGAPAPSFFASGNFGQTVLIMPESDIVVARFSESALPAAETFAATLRIGRLAAGMAD